MARKKSTSSQVTQATREGNARAGYCASAFFASASDIPAIVSDALPDEAFCTLDDMVKGLRGIESYLKAMNPSKGKHFVLINVQEARELALTLVLADTSIGLDEVLDPTHAIAADHRQLKDTVQAVKEIIGEAQSGATNYEKVRDQLDKLPNQALITNVLSLLEQRVTTVQSLAGPIDLSMGKTPVKQVASSRNHVLRGRVAGGYDEQANTVAIEITALVDADPRLFMCGCRITVKVLQEEQRVTLLLTQLAKVQINVTLSLPRIPITLSSPAKVDLKADLITIEVLEQQQSLDKIKTSLLQQLDLDV